MKHKHGFAFIELMIVVAIVGILAAIAIPAYRDFQLGYRLDSEDTRTPLERFISENELELRIPPICSYPSTRAYRDRCALALKQGGEITIHCGLSSCTLIGTK